MMSSSLGVKHLVDRVCLVTGASRGIGKGIALQLGEAGALVYITGRQDFGLFKIQKLTHPSLRI